MHGKQIAARPDNVKPSGNYPRKDSKMAMDEPIYIVMLLENREGSCCCFRNLD